MSEANTLEIIILRNLLHNDQYTRIVVPFLKPAYFEGPCRTVFNLLVDFVGKYNNLPNAEALTVELENNEKITEQQGIQASHVINDIATNIEVEQNWLLESTEKWCQDRSIYLAIMESIEIIDNKHDTLSKDALPDLLANALAINFDTSVGHDYIEEASDRYEFYHLTESKLPFDIEKMNEVTNGGLPNKTLNVFMGGPGSGKSLVMCHFAASNLLRNKNVLYITMEMAEERIAERIDANMMNITLQDLDQLDKDKFTSKINKISAKTQGRLIIKEYPTGGAHAGHFRALIRELKMKKKFVPQVIYIDYINICASSRIKGGLGGSINTYSLVKSIAEELRGLAVENNVPIISATQTNRDGIGSSDVDMTDTSESIGLPQTVDSLFGLVTTEELENLGQIMFKQLKNRYGDINNNKRFLVGIDRSKMKLYDIEDSAQTLSQGAGTSYVPPVQGDKLINSFGGGGKKDFTKFKV